MLSPMTESHFLKAYLISEVHLKKCLIMKPSPVHPNQRCNSFFLRTPKNLTDTLLMPFILFDQVQVLGWTDVFIGWVGRRGINGSQDTYMFKRKCSKKKKENAQIFPSGCTIRIPIGHVREFYLFHIHVFRK